MHASQEARASAQALYGFAVYHQGDIPFWYGGDIWASPASATPLTVGFGDGVTTHFLLPNRHILTGPTIRVEGIVEAEFTLTASSGLIVFSVAPADQGIITAEAHTCKYKCVFWMGEEVLLSEEQFYPNMSRFEGIILRELAI